MRFPSVLSAIVGSIVVVACSGTQQGNRDYTGEVHSPGFTVPHAVAEGTGDPDPPLDELDAGVGEAAPPEPQPEPPKMGYQPDPEPLRLRRQWQYTLRFASEDVKVLRVRPLLYPRPVVTARRMGRWALELWIGRELIDRVRFDFPGLAAETPRKGKRRPLHETPSLAPGAEVDRTILVPASPRATRAVLVDRATGREITLPWPPDQPLGPPVDEAPAAKTVQQGSEVDAGLTSDAGPEAGIR